MNQALNILIKKNTKSIKSIDTRLETQGELEIYFMQSTFRLYYRRVPSVNKLKYYIQYWKLGTK